MTEPRPARLGLELTLLVVLAGLWGSSYLFIKIAVEGIPPLTLIALRVSIAAVFLLLVMAWYDQRLPQDRGTWGRLFIQAVLNAIGAWTLLAWGQQYVASGLAAVLNSTSPLFVFFITLAVTRHERVGGARLFGALVGALGVSLIVGFDAWRGIGAHVAGEAAVLLSACLYGGAAIHGRRFSHLPAAVTAAGTMIWAAICLIPASLVIDQPWTLNATGVQLSAALALGIFCTGTALLIYFRLVRTLGSMGVASQSYLRAGIGVGLGMVFLGEAFSIVIMLGIVACILGVALINARPRSP